MRAWIVRQDHRIMKQFARPLPRWLRLWMLACTRSGDGWLWYIVGGTLGLFGDQDRWKALGASVVASMMGVALFLVLKRKIRRLRPFGIERRHTWLLSDQWSFPSGHTISAFAVAVSLGIFYPHLKPWLFLSAAMIGMSRIMLGMHFLSDVVAGAVLGAGLGEMAGHLVRHFSVQDAGMWIKAFLV